MTPFGTHRDDQVLTGIADHNGGSAHSIFGKTVTDRNSTAPPAPPPRATYTETVGGNAHTWTNYTNAGGTQGPTISAYATVRVSCKIRGFRVADGNTWWYRIASRADRAALDPVITARFSPGWNG